MSKIKQNVIKLITLALFVSIFIGINRYLDVLILYPVSYYRWQNYELSLAGNKYDTIAFGPSDCIDSFDPEVANEVLGTQSFNYGLTAADYGNCVPMSVLNADTFQDFSTAIFFIPHYEIVRTQLEPVLTYERSAMYMHNPLVKALYFFKSSLKGGAITRLAPWSSRLVNFKLKDWPDLITEGMEFRSREAYKNYDPDVLGDNSEGITYYGDGYYNYDITKTEMMDYDDYPDIHNDEGKYYTTEIEVQKEAVKDIKRVIGYCQKKNIRPVMVAGTMSLIALYDHPEYYDEMTQIKQIATDMGVEFYDMNMIRKEYWRGEEGDWKNLDHLGYDGCIPYTKTLCNLINAAEAGEDTDMYFYQSWEEFISSIDDVQAVKINAEVIESEIDDSESDEDEPKDVHYSLSACGITGNPETVEYRYVGCSLEASDEKEVYLDQDILQDWSQDNGLEIDDSLGYDAVRVYARTKAKPELARYTTYVLKK